MDLSVFMSGNSNTVILFFAHSAKEDLKLKRFSKASVHYQLFTKLHRHTLRTLRSCKLPILHFSEENQNGLDLAERLTNAVAEAFAKGYKNVIAVGNDTPDLSANGLLRAAAVLAKGGSVLGPSADGGNYLIGINQRHFHKNAFCTALREADNTHKKLVELLESPLELETLTDIDDEKSLNHWINSFSYDLEKLRLRKEILTLFASGFRKFKISQDFSSSVILSRITDRGPPRAA